MSSIIRIPVNSVNHARRQKKSKGINLGFCRVCTCELKLIIISKLFQIKINLGFNMEFLTTKCALLKLFEIILGSCCETLLIRFGLPAATDIGEK